MRHGKRESEEEEKREMEARESDAFLFSISIFDDVDPSFLPCPPPPFDSHFFSSPKPPHKTKPAALGVLDAAAGLQAASNPAAPQNVPQRRKREKRPKTEDEENLLPRRASGRIAAAGGTRNYNEKSFYSFSYSPLGEKSAAASSSSRAPKGPPRVPSSCHSCRQKRDEMGGPAAEGSNCWRCDGARGRFCRGCLSMRYGLSVEAIKLANEKAEEELARRGKEEEKETEGEEGDEERALSGAASADNEEGKEEEKEEEKDDDEGGGKSAAPPISSSLPSPCGWLCPHCYEEVFGASHGWICNSSLCLKKRPVPIQPTGVAVFESRAAGHASVAHALQAKLTENGRLNGGMVGPWIEGLGCVIEGLTDLASVERRRAETKEEERRKKAAADAADAADVAAAGGVAPSSSSSPPPAAGKENDSGGNATAKRPRGRPPKSAGGGGGGARAATAEKEEEEKAAPPPLPLAASAALPQPAA